MILTNFYLNFPGQAEEALRFYQSVLGGEFPVIMRMKDMPGMPGAENLTPADKNKIMHMALQLPNGAMIMASDAMETMGYTVTMGNHFSLSVSTSSKEEADVIYAGLSDGGSALSGMKVEMWGAYFGTFADKYGVQWMVSYDANPGQGELFEKLESSRQN
ncbi:MAG: VOC family protein [Chitinophagaceae bacterium]